MATTLLCTTRTRTGAGPTFDGQELKGSEAPRRDGREEAEPGRLPAHASGSQGPVTAALAVHGGPAVITARRGQHGGCGGPQRDDRGRATTAAATTAATTTPPRPARRHGTVAPVAQPRPRHDRRGYGGDRGRDRRSRRAARPSRGGRARARLRVDARTKKGLAPVNDLEKDPHPVSRRPAQSRLYGCPISHRCNLTLPDCRRDIAQHLQNGTIDAYARRWLQKATAAPG